MADPSGRPRARRRASATDPDDLDDPRVNASLGTFPEERPDLYGVLWNEHLDFYLRDWKRRRGVLVAREQPDPRDLMPPHRGLPTGVLPEPSPPEDLAGNQMVRWHYWQDVIGTLQTLARLIRHGQPLALARPPVVEGTLDEREGRETLAELLDVVSDLLRDQTHGKAHPEPRRRKNGRPPSSPRRVEAAALALAAADLQADAGVFRTFTEAEAAAAALFGLQPGSLRARCREAVWKKAKAVLGERMRRQIEVGDQAAWLEARIRQAAEQDKEAEITP